MEKDENRFKMGTGELWGEHSHWAVCFYPTDKSP